MPSIIPMSPAGERTVTVNVGPDVFIFRTYFVSGQDDHWLLDILDAQETPLITGINLIPGVDNLLKGMGDTLKGYQLHLLVESGTEKDLDALGNTMSLVWFNPGEDNPAVPSDPMDTIGTEIVPW
ncbi:phage baseplate plug family protein [Desulfovibrio falkowii]|uniref:phage baseplate plug family protein n=2 Tax=Desulfovibrio TaxID=872 RepID=UPI00372D38FA